jgi:hypothetical protein
VNRTFLRFVVPFLMLGACAVPGAGQEVKIVIYTLQDLSGPTTSHDFEQTITDALAAEFGSSGDYKVLPQADWETAARAKSLVPRDLLSGSAAAGLARGISADMAVSGSYALVTADGDQRIALSLQCWDAATGQLLAGLQRATRFDLAFYISLHDWVADLVRSLQSGDAVPTQAAAAANPAPMPAEITFVSRDEGMAVLIAGDTRAGVIADGKLTFPVGSMAVGTPLQVIKQKSGYHESAQTVKAAPQVTLTPLAKEHISAAELIWTTGQMAGLGAALRGYVVPDSFYVYAGDYLYVQTPVVPALRAILHDDLYFGFGAYLFFPPDAPLRLSLATGAGLIWSHFSQPGMPVYTDFYLDVASWTLETRILGPILFLRQDYKYTLGISTNLAGRGWPVKGFPLTTIGVLFQ